VLLKMTAHKDICQTLLKPEGLRRVPSESAMKKMSSESSMGSSPSSKEIDPLKQKNIYYWDPKSLRIRTINFWHVFLSEYITWTYKVAIAGVVGLMLWQWWSGHFDLSGVRALKNDAYAMEVVFIAAVLAAYLFRSKPNIYCIDNAVYVPPKDWQVTREEVQRMMRTQGVFEEGSLDFMGRLLDKSGTGDSTHWPPSYLPSRDGETKAQRTMVWLVRRLKLSSSG
jgi:hypothetical protein